MTTTESPAALLRRAVAYLEGICPLGEEWDHDSYTDRAEVWAEIGDGQDRELVTVIPAGTWKVDNAAWIAAMGPQVRAPLIAWLRVEADRVDRTVSSWHPSWKQAIAAVGEQAHGPAVALARALLGETGEQP